MLYQSRVNFYPSYFNPISFTLLFPARNSSEEEKNPEWTIIYLISYKVCSYPRTSLQLGFVVFCASQSQQGINLHHHKPLKEELILFWEGVNGVSSKAFAIHLRFLKWTHWDANTIFFYKNDRTFHFNIFFFFFTVIYPIYLLMSNFSLRKKQPNNENILRAKSVW